MERLAYAITDFLLRRQVIKQEEYEIYLYGYSVLLEQLLQVAVEWLLEMPFLLLQDQLVGPLPVRRCLHLSFFSLRTR